MILKLVFSCHLLLIVVSSAWASDPIVRSPAGTFLGSTLTAMNGQVYNAFRGIPFAKPPLRDLRFQPPIPLDHIDGLYDATDFKPHCIQLNIIPNSFSLGQEDCLYLNVFTPRCSDRNDGHLKKVFVFFHGGGNYNGFTHVYLPGTLVTEQDIVVVTVAYRVGYLALLSTMTPSCEGNLHLKDQLLALAWVQENILDFGGDPAEVTIGGESAGGFDTGYLTLLPGSRDLFARAYCQSGVPGTKNTLMMTNPRPEAIKLARRLGCLREEQPDPVADSEFEKLVDCLKQVPAEQFAVNGTADIPNLQTILSDDLFPKNIEELFSDENYLKSINFFERNYLVGVNENEGDLFSIINKQTVSALPEEASRSLTPEVMYYKTIEMFLAPVFGPVSQQVIQKVAEYYESNTPLSPLGGFCGDALFNIAAVQYVTAAAAGRSSLDSHVYFFRFVHSPEYILESYKGLLHGNDLLYLFDLDIDILLKILPLKVDVNKWNKNDDLLKQKFTRLVGDFINTGNPGKSLASELPSGWPGFDKKQQQYLEFGLKSEVKQRFISDRVQLWSEQIPKWIRDYPLTRINDEL
ncbi:hypothetical protein BsWGS_03115 [Bradybaena similaris]